MRVFCPGWPSLPDLLQVAGLRVARQGRRIFDGVSFSVAAGERVALVGPNGGGKTTLLRLVAGLLRPDGGAVLLAGRRAHAIPARQRSLGYLPQRAQDAFLETSVEAEVGGAALEEAGLFHLAARHPLTLSEGERRRVALVRALRDAPALLLLDEPTAGLDAAAALGLVTELGRKSPGAAVLLATHDWDLALHCDRVLVVAEGGVHPAGAPPEFLAGVWPSRLGWEVA